MSSKSTDHRPDLFLLKTFSIPYKRKFERQLKFLPIGIFAKIFVLRISSHLLISFGAFSTALPLAFMTKISITQIMSKTRENDHWTLIRYKQTTWLGLWNPSLDFHNFFHVPINVILHITSLRYLQNCFTVLIGRWPSERMLCLPRSGLKIEIENTEDTLLVHSSSSFQSKLTTGCVEILLKTFNSI